MIQALGSIRVAVPGVPQRITSNLTLPAERFTVHGVLIQVLPGNTGRIYVGTATLNRAAFTGLYGMLAVPTVNVLPTFSAALTLAPNAVQLNEMFVDADNATDGVIVSVLIT